MSEANILNPTSSSQLNPGYSYVEQLPEMVATFQADSGKEFARHVLDRGRYIDMAWERRDKATMHTLRQWHEQYRRGFFTYLDHERTRYFSGRFEGELQISPAGNERWNLRARFAELAGVPLNTYPSNWSRDAVFYEERNDFDETLAKLTGTWNTETDANDHGGKGYNSNVTNDTAEWVYFGYGFRFWSKKQGNLGEVEVSATRVRDSAVVLAATTVDLYNAGAVASAALVTKADLPLDEYRVKLRVKGTKNGSSSGFFVIADAIEVMR